MCLETCQAFMMEIVRENRRFLAVRYFRTKAPTYMFHKVLNAPL